MDFDNLSEKELINTCIQESKEAWDAFVEKYTELIYHAINKLLQDNWVRIVFYSGDRITVVSGALKQECI